MATTSPYTWDIFLAHAGPDKSPAEQLYDQLYQKCRVFLDSRCLILGDDWDVKLPEAQNASLMTVVLVSGNTRKAYYQREEIAAAIDLARKEEEDAQKEDKGHRVVPIYLGQQDALEKEGPLRPAPQTWARSIGHVFSFAVCHTSTRDVAAVERRTGWTAIAGWRNFGDAAA